VLWLETIDPDGPVDPATGIATVVRGMITYDVYTTGPKPGSKPLEGLYNIGKGKS